MSDLLLTLFVYSIAQQLFHILHVSCAYPLLIINTMENSLELNEFDPDLFVHLLTVQMLVVS